MSERTVLLAVHPRILGLALALFAAIGCERKEAAVQHVAQLVRVDTLAETESMFVARVTRAYVASDGRILISDQAQQRVLEFDSTGAFVRSIGRDGEGPGEFRGPAAIAEWGDDSLIVTELTNRRISVFRRSSGEFLWHADGLGSVSSVGAIGARMVVASLAPDSFTSVGVIDPGRRALRPALPLPDSLLREPLAIASFPRSVVGVGGARLVTAVLWSDVALVYDSSLTLQSSFAIPRRVRRPIPENLEEALRPVANGAGRLTLMPALITIEVLRNGWIVFVHKDWVAPPGGIVDPARVAIDATMRAYATVVDLDQRKSCADIELPAEWAENPHFISDGSSLAGVGHVVGASARPTLEVRRYDLGLGQCDWQPLAVVTP